MKDIVGEGEEATHPEHSLYRVIQPMGLLYGQSVSLANHPDAGDWDERDRMKILIAESLISSSLVFHNKKLSTPDELSSVIVQSLENIANFYNKVFPELATPSKTLLGRKRSALEMAERLLEKRIDTAAEFAGNFWARFFHNSLFFLDVFIFGQWIHTREDKIVADFFRYERDELRFSVVKIIAAAAHATKTIELEERRLLEIFLQSTGMSAERKKEARTLFERGIEVEEINLPDSNSWILRKYFLEMAILTVWADKQVDNLEIGFLQRLAKYLNFTEEDLANSMMATEGFMLEHWSELDLLKDKVDIDRVGKTYLDRLVRLTAHHKTRLLKETQANEDLMNLLRTARTRELLEPEKERLQVLLLGVLKTIPSFVMISLPQRFLTLPILMNVLPRNFFAESLTSGNT